MLLLRRYYFIHITQILPMTNRYFKAETTKDGQTRVSHRQTSIVRTNCMDCLDRTNVVQSVISRWVLTRQLQELGILSPNESIESHEQFEALFRNGNKQFSVDGFPC